MPPRRNEEDANFGSGWRRLMAQVIIYQFGRALHGIAASIFGYYRSRREPGALAPSITRQQTSADRRVNKAAAQLQVAKSKQEATAARIAQAKAKSLGKASAKTKAAAGPPPVKAASSGISPTATGTGGTPVKTGPAMDTPVAGDGVKNRPVVTGFADPYGGPAQPPMMNAQQMQQLIQMMMLQTQGGNGVGSSSSTGYPVPADMANAFLQSPMYSPNPEYYYLEQPTTCRECGGSLVLDSENGTVCSSCGWIFVNNDEMEEGFGNFGEL